MARLEFDECPWFDYSHRDEFPVEVAETEGPFYSDRYALAPISRRVYGWHLKRTTTERQTVAAFLVLGRMVGLEAFYVRDPKDDFRTNVDLGNGDGGKTVFDLPDLPLEDGRFYPRDDLDLEVRVSGAPVGVAAVDVDARTITLSAPPGLGLPVVADFQGLRLVRLANPAEWAGIGADWYETTLELLEVVRD